MSDFAIRPTDPRTPQATALLEASHALMQSLFDAEDNHYLEISELCQDHIHFFAAWDGDYALGCIALAAMADYGEVKSMFVSPTARGKGIGAALLTHLQAAAAAMGLKDLKLETGNTLYDAHRLYERAGFQRCGVFGNYAESPASIFMQKSI